MKCDAKFSAEAIEELFFLHIHLMREYYRTLQNTHLIRVRVFPLIS